MSRSISSPAVLDRRQPLDALFDPSTGDKAWRALPERDRRLARAIVTAALRHHGEIEAVLARLIERPPRRAGQLFRILEVAAAQLLYLDVPDHAAVSVAMDQVTADRDALHFKGLANAVLRRMGRERARSSLRSTRRAPPFRTGSGAAGSRAYGEDAARRIAAANLEEPALDLTVKADPEGWAERLGGIVLPTGSVRLVPDGAVPDLPGFAEGEWWVQDAAAAIPARLLTGIAGKRVADLCAAPGGKTAALIQAGRPRHRRRRLGRAAEAGHGQPRAASACRPMSSPPISSTWTPPEPFDAILLDAPCTATGTIRRHPDIAWLKRPEDVASLADLQGRMIDRAVRWLKPGGVLVYATCSLEPEEGEHQMARALHRHDLEILPVDPAEIGGIAEAVLPSGAIRTLPFQLAGPTPRLSGLDGFFVMRVRRR